MGICVYIPTQKNLSTYFAVEGEWVKDSDIPGRIGVIIASYSIIIESGIRILWYPDYRLVSYFLI